MFHYKIPLWVQKGHGWLLVNPHSLTDHNPWKQTSAAYIWLRKFLCTTGQPKMLFLWGYLSINNFARKLTDTKCYKGADGADINHWHCTSVFWNQETLPSCSGRSAVIPATLGTLWTWCLPPDPMAGLWPGREFLHGAMRPRREWGLWRKSAKLGNIFAYISLAPGLSNRFKAKLILVLLC